MSDNKNKNLPENNLLNPIDPSSNPNQIKWGVEKNTPTPVDIATQEPDKYKGNEKDVLKDNETLNGYRVEVSFNKSSFYKISLLDFLPFFLGVTYSLIKVIIAYGDIRKATPFNRKLFSYFWNNIIICINFALFVWPLLLAVIYIFYPYFVLNPSDVTRAWISFDREISTNGVSALGTALSKYIDIAIKPLFTPERAVVTALIWILISAVNFQTFLFYFFFRFKKKLFHRFYKENTKERLIDYLKVTERIKQKEAKAAEEVATTIVKSRV